MMLPKSKLPDLLKFKFTSGIVGVLIIIITLSLIAVSIQYNATNVMVEVPEPPLPVVKPEPSLNVIVEIAVESSSGLYHGGGLRVGNIIVTSAMLFNGDDQVVTVEGLETKIIRRDDRLGLVALQSSKTFDNEVIGYVPSVDKIVNTPVGETAMVSSPNPYDVEIFRYFSDGDRMILIGEDTSATAGYPVLQGDVIIGITIGLNSADIDQVIAVSSEGLVKFITGDYESP